MSQRHPLHYPAPSPEVRSFNALKLIPPVENLVFLFDRIFNHQIVRDRIRPILLHGIILAVIGAALAALGHSYMLVRSVAVFVCAICLVLELAVWISGAKWQRQYKAIVFCAVTYILESSGMGIMYWFLDSTLEDQQADVVKGFKAEASTPSASNPWGTVFSVTNNSPFRLVNAEISCLVHRISDFNANEFGGPWSKTPPSKTVEPNGDVSTNDCLNVVKNPSLVVCSDVEIKLSYSLETQPAIKNNVRYRFVGEPQNGLFQWTQKGLNKKDPYCPTPHLPPFQQ